MSELVSLNTPLGKAIFLLNRGETIPMDLAADLMAQGIDIPALEARHFKEN